MPSRGFFCSRRCSRAWLTRESNRVESGWVKIIVKYSGSGRVGSKILAIYFRLLENSPLMVIQTINTLYFGVLLCILLVHVMVTNTLHLKNNINRKINFRVVVNWSGWVSIFACVRRVSSGQRNWTGRYLAFFFSETA